MNRTGFTIIEMLVAITIFAIVVGAGLQVLGAQGRGMARGADRVSATQNLQYAVGSLTRDLRTTGTSVPAGQPFLVYADSEVVAFNADYVTNTVGDPSAVYYDPDAPAGSVMALTLANQITIPLSSFKYPAMAALAGFVERAEADWRSVDPNAFHAAKEALDRSSVRLQEIGIAESLREEGSRA